MQNYIIVLYYYYSLENGKLACLGLESEVILRKHFVLEYSALGVEYRLIPAQPRD